MSSSVIDALVVTLGLDSKGFSDGIQGATASLTGFATKVAGLALGFKGLEAGIQYFESLHKKLSDLYFTGRNLGVFGTELSRLGELAKLFGGNMEDAAGSVNTLQSAVFNLRFKGQMSESLSMLQRFGVGYLTQQGHMRDPEQIARDAAVAIERQAQAAGLNSGERFQLAQSFGLQGGLASAAAAGPAEFDKELARARADHGRHGNVLGLSEGMLRDQANLSRDIISRQAQRDIEMAQVLSKLVPALEDFNEWLQDLAQAAIPTLIGGMDLTKKAFTAVEHAAKSAATALEKFKVATTLPAERANEKPVNVLSPFSYTWRIGEHISEQIANKLDQLLNGAPSDSKPKFPGVASGSISRPPPAQAPMLHAPVTPLAPRPPSEAAVASKPTAMNNGGTNITFENVTVNSRGQDGAALARDFTNSVRRKLNVSSADAGMYS